MIHSREGAPPEVSVAVAFQMRAVPRDCLKERIRALTDDEEAELELASDEALGRVKPTEMYRLCERLQVNFLLGLGPNVRLKKMAAPLQDKAKRRFLRTGQKVRLFSSVRYRARRRWPRSYRVVIKAEHQAIGPNVRFVVTNLSGRAQGLYDGCYVARGEACENSIKDLKNVLKADRLSCHRFWANQFRLLLHCAAYVLMYAIHRAARGTELANAQMDTLRLRLLKIGVRVESTVRRIWFHLTSGHPWQPLWSFIAGRLVGGSRDSSSVGRR